MKIPTAAAKFASVNANKLSLFSFSAVNDKNRPRSK